MKDKGNYMRRIPLSEPHLVGNEWRYVKECLDTGWISSAGRFVDKFETSVSNYVKAKQAVACVNGTSALHAALLALGIGPGDEVIVPTVTFIAPVNAIRYTGAVPVFMDCDEYLNIDVAKVRFFCDQECRKLRGALVNRRTGRKIRAVIPVHVFGHPCRMEDLMTVAKAFRIKVIEDATESLGSFFTQGGLKGKMAGAVGDAGCFSFNGNKIVTAGGGGMIASNDKQVITRARYLTTQAKDDGVHYVHNEVGYNYRLTNLQAAVGLAQMECLDEFIRIKRRNYSLWREALAGISGLSFIDEPSYARSNYWFYSLVVDEKNFGCDNLKLMRFLRREGIETRPLWQLNHLQKPYRQCQAYKIENAPGWHRRILNLPCSVTLTAADIKRVMKVVKDHAST